MSDPLGAFRLDGRVAVVAGASSGLGEAVARQFAAVGATVVLAARRLDRIEKLAAELGGLAVRCDVAAENDCAAVAHAAGERFGRVDVLVNSAGVGAAGSALHEEPAVFRHTLDVNLLGAYWMSRACVPLMPPGSAVVNVSSVHGLVASRFPQAGYAASKAGLIGLTRDLARQWTARRGIRVNALCPGYFDSELTAEGADQLHDMVRDGSIVGRFASIDEITPAVLFLASPASSYMTGATVVVDGGLSAVV